MSVRVMRIDGVWGRGRWAAPHVWAYPSSNYEENALSVTT